MREAFRADLAYITALTAFDVGQQLTQAGPGYDEPTLRIVTPDRTIERIVVDRKAIREDSQ